MAEYVSIEAVKEVASAAAGNPYQVIEGKRIMFQSKLENGESIVMCTPQSKLHPQGFYWVDITEIQYDVLESAENGIIIFRLEGQKLMMVAWCDLKPYFLPECMRNNPKEGNHWKLNIFNDHIKVSGNPSELKTSAFRYAGKNK